MNIMKIKKMQNFIQPQVNSEKKSNESTYIVIFIFVVIFDKDFKLIQSYNIKLDKSIVFRFIVSLYDMIGTIIILVNKLECQLKPFVGHFKKT